MHCNPEVERAEQLLVGGASCSEAVLGSLGIGSGLSEATLCALALPLAGGLVLRGHTCGVAVSGLLAIGLGWKEKDLSSASCRAACFAQCDEFLAWFEQEHGTLECRYLCEGGELPSDRRAQLLRNSGTPKIYVLSSVRKLTTLLGRA